MIKKNRIIGVMILILSMLFTQKMVVFAKAPALTMEHVSISKDKISKEDTFTASFALRNSSNDYLKDIYIKIPSPNFSVVGKGSSFLVISELSWNQSAAVNIELKCHNTTENRIPIIITYDSGGSIETIEEQLIVSFNDEVKETNKPEFLLLGGDIQKVETGTTSTMSITLKNTSDYEAKNVIISPELTAENMADLKLNKVNMSPENIKMAPGTENEFSFDMTVNGITTPGIYPITYKVSCQNKNNETVTSSFNGYIKVIENTTATNVHIMDVSVSPGTLRRNDDMTVSVEVENGNEKKIDNLKVWIEGFSPESFIYQGKKLEKILNLPDYGAKTAKFKYKIAKNAVEGNYPYEIHLSFTDDKGNQIQYKDTYQLYLPAGSSDKGSLEIKNIIMPSQAITAEKTFSVGFDICNTGKSDLENIDIAFSNSAEIWSKSPANIHVKVLPAGSSKRVEYSMEALKQEKKVSIPLSFQIQYDDKPGDETEVKTLNQSIGVLVNSSKTATSQPKLVINSVDMPSQIIPGEAFDLSFTVQNTNNKKSAKNIKMTLSSVDPVTQVSNIITVGQSDSVYINSLKGEEQKEAKLKLMIPESYKNSVCDIKIGISYEDAKGNAYIDQEAIHLPITEKLQLTTSDVRMGMVNETGYTLELDFYNTGKGVLKNLMVDLEGDYDSTNSNYYVGDLQSGRMDIYSVYINGEAPEKLSGNIIFSYEDNTGKAVSQKVPFDITYTKPAVEASSAEVKVKEKKESSGGTILIGIGAIVIIAVVIRIYKKRKAV